MSNYSQIDDPQELKKIIVGLQQQIEAIDNENSDLTDQIGGIPPAFKIMNDIKQILKDQYKNRQADNDFMEKTIVDGSPQFIHPYAIHGSGLMADPPKSCCFSLTNTYNYYGPMFLIGLSLKFNAQNIPERVASGNLPAGRYVDVEICQRSWQSEDSNYCDKKFECPVDKNEYVAFGMNSKHVSSGALIQVNLSFSSTTTENPKKFWVLYSKPVTREFSFQDNDHNGIINQYVSIHKDGNSGWIQNRSDGSIIYSLTFGTKKRAVPRLENLYD